MSKIKLPYVKPVLDPRGKQIEVGSKVAYAVRKGNEAVLRVGKVEFIEACSPTHWRHGIVPVIYARFDGNEKVSRCEKPENMIVLS